MLSRRYPLLHTTHLYKAHPSNISQLLQKKRQQTLPKQRERSPLTNSQHGILKWPTSFTLDRVFYALTSQFLVFFKHCLKHKELIFFYQVTLEAFCAQYLQALLLWQYEHIDPAKAMATFAPASVNIKNQPQRWMLTFTKSQSIWFLIPCAVPSQWTLKLWQHHLGKLIISTTI